MRPNQDREPTMSAYVVSNDTIDLILSVAQRVARHDANIYLGESARYNLHTDAQALGQILLNENYRSVNARYNETGEPEAYRFRHVDTDRAGAGMDPAILVLGSIKCLRYQSCETEDYPTTDAARILNAIENKATSYLMSVHDAPWGWTRDWMESQIAEKKAKIAAQFTTAR
jgi:hypothetical protein